MLRLRRGRLGSLTSYTERGGRTAPWGETARGRAAFLGYGENISVGVIERFLSLLKSSKTVMQRLLFAPCKQHG